MVRLWVRKLLISAFLSVLLVSVLILQVGAQQINVQSFRFLENDLDARVNHPIRDQNGELCAIIKVVTTRTGIIYSILNLSFFPSPASTIFRKVDISRSVLSFSILEM